VPQGQPDRHRVSACHRNETGGRVPQGAESEVADPRKIAGSVEGATELPGGKFPCRECSTLKHLLQFLCSSRKIFTQNGDRIILNTGYH
jgi:hypothetical protein